MLTAAVDHNLHRVAHVQIVDRAVQGVHGGHIGSVDAEENVAFFNALGGGVAAAVNVGDIQPGGEPVVILVERGQGLPLQTQRGPAGDIALRDQLLCHLLHGGAGNGEAQTLHTGGVGERADLHGVDADDLTVAVDERAAGVAGIQGGIGLDQGHGAPVHIHVPPDAGDDAVGVSAPEFDTQRVADGDHGVAHPEGIGIAELRRGQSRRVYVQHRKVGHGISAHQHGGQCPAVRQLRRDGDTVFYHMAVGHDVPVLRQDHAGAGGGCALTGAGDGYHGVDIPAVNFLKGQRALGGDVLHALRAFLQVDGGSVLAQGGVNGFRGKGGGLRGQLRAGGEGNGLLAFPPGVQFLEQPHVQNAQNRDDAAQKDN